MSEAINSFVRSSVTPDCILNAIRPDTPGRLLMRSSVTPIEQITGVWKFVRIPGDNTRIYTLAGHVIQLIIQGTYTLRTLGNQYRVGKGNLIYFHDSQEIETLNVLRPVTFYSVGFIAPSFRPLPGQECVVQSTKEICEAFKTLYHATHITNPVHQKLSVFAALYSLLAMISHTRSMSLGDVKEEDMWWVIERDLRLHGVFRPTIADLCSMCHRGRATINRLCRKATDTSPMQRLQAVRMAEAMSLLKYCPMTVTQVAEYLGYTRMHEFSREFSSYFGMCPSTVRTPPE